MAGTPNWVETDAFLLFDVYFFKKLPSPTSRGIHYRPREVEARDCMVHVCKLHSFVFAPFLLVLLAAHTGIPAARSRISFTHGMHTGMSPKLPGSSDQTLVQGFLHVSYHSMAVALVSFPSQRVTLGCVHTGPLRPLLSHFSQSLTDFTSGYTAQRAQFARYTTPQPAGAFPHPN